MLKIIKLIRFTASIFFCVLLSSCGLKKTSYIQAKYNYAHGDYSRAFQQLWYPAQHNDPRALYAMGYMYYYGIGTDQDLDLGRSLIRRAADRCFPPAIAAMKLITQARYTQYVPLENYHISPPKGYRYEGNTV